MPGRLVRRLALAGLALCAITPIVVSAVDVGRGWVPVSDTAIVATRSRDVFTTHTPLLGQPSTAGIDVGEDVHHPGPLEYWLIAVAQRVHDGAAVSLIAVALVNVAAVAVAVTVAASIGGVPLAAWTAAVLAALGWSLRGEVLVDPLNPYAALLPFAAFLVCAVAVTARRWWALVPAVVLGSYAAQAHLTTAAMVAVAFAGTAVGLLAAKAPIDVQGTTGWRRPALVSGSLLLVCWSAPLVDVVTRSGGNVAALAATGGARAAAGATLGASADKAVNALASLPIWLRSGADVPSLLSRPTAVERTVAVALVAAALALGLVAGRRRSPSVVTGGAVVATTLLAGGTWVFARFPSNFFNVFALGNYLWLWPTSALLWGVVVAGTLTLVRRAAPPVASTVAGATAALGAAAFALLAVADPSSAPVERGRPAMVRALSQELASTLDRDATYLVDLSVDFDEQAVDTGVVHELVRRGFDIRVTPFFEPSYDWRAESADVDGVLRVVVDREDPVAEGGGEGEVVASFDPSPGARRRFERAERSVVARLEARGGLDEDLFPAFGKQAPPSVEAFVQSDFLTMAVTGFLGETARWPETRELQEARRQPVLRAVVVLRANES